MTLAWSSEELRARVLPKDWYRYIANFSEVEGHRSMLVCWLGGSGARVADQLEDDEVRNAIKF